MWPHIASSLFATFQNGWYAPSLLSAEKVVDAVRASGMEVISDDELTEFLKLGQPRNMAIRALVSLLRPVPVCDEPVDKLKK